MLVNLYRDSAGDLRADPEYDPSDPNLYLVDAGERALAWLDRAQSHRYEAEAWFVNRFGEPPAPQYEDENDYYASE